MIQRGSLTHALQQTYTYGHFAKTHIKRVIIITDFSVGGELRLCLPQILRQTLAQFHWQQICRACEELQIHCAPCSSSQLVALKSAGVLPVAAHQCGLITKSDAERLTSYLMIQNSQVGA